MATQCYFFHTSSSLSLAVCVHSVDSSYVSLKYLMTPKLLISEGSNRIVPCCKHYSNSNLEKYYIKQMIPLCV